MLAEFIQAEVVDPTDMDMRGMLHTIGIEKGKPFQPDAATKALHFYPDRQWLNVFAG